MSILMSRHMCVNCKAILMKRLVIILSILFTTNVEAQTPQQILRSEGFVLVTKENDKEIYYRPNEVKKHDGIVYYSTTKFFTNGSNKYSLESNYVALACKEQKIIWLGIHKVPYIGKSSYKDLTKNGIKDKDIKPLTSLDRKMHSKLCS